MNILCSNSYCNHFRQPQHWLQERIFIKLIALRKDSVCQISEVYPSKRFGEQPQINIDQDCPTPRTAATSAIPTTTPMMVSTATGLPLQVTSDPITMMQTHPQSDSTTTDLRGEKSSMMYSTSGHGHMVLWDMIKAWHVLNSRLVLLYQCSYRTFLTDFQDNLIILGSNACKMKIWSASTCKCVRTLIGHDLLVPALSFDPANGHLVSASYDRTVKVWDLRTGKMSRDIRNSHVSHIFDVKFNVAQIARCT